MSKTMSKQDRPWEAAFFAALEKTGIISQAAKMATVGRRTVYDHLKKDLEFTAKCRNALDTAADNLEMEGIRRAVGR